MNPGKHHFPVAVFCKPPYLFHDALHAPAAHPSPCKRNDAVRAKLVAPVLYFDIGAGMLSWLRQMQILIFPGVVDIDHPAQRGISPLYRCPDAAPLFLFNRFPRFSGSALQNLRLLFFVPPARCLPACFRTVLQILFQDLYQVLLPVIPDHNVYRRVRRMKSLLGLHIASCRDHHCRRIHFPGTVQHLPGLPVRNVGHGAGIDDINIRLLLKRHDLISRPFQQLLHRRRLICIYLTSQIMQCRLSHSFPLNFFHHFLDF